ncbi:hypothetical protein CAOG_005355 [Capsaspora owczarzaki ATCC 30864]|uniref:DUF5898 domain-containing protein n=1 Tax=Capsaspora owczarzaki (strain ATCC 30864) TaxID=595528 RepID=A0A0D2X3R5_CAPO3|nr:hypothetical protein CAOG_005355 [Capsaspora owczarzaki ATCC 30864]
MASSSNSAHPAAAAAGLSPSDSSAASEEDDFLKRFESFSLALGPAEPAPPPLDPADVMRKYDELAKAVANLSLKEVKTDVEGVVEKVKPLYTAVGVVNDYIDYALTMFPTLTPMSAQFCLDSIQRPVKTYRKEVEALLKARLAESLQPMIAAKLMHPHASKDHKPATCEQAAEPFGCFELNLAERPTFAECGHANSEASVHLDVHSTLKTINLSLGLPIKMRAEWPHPSTTTADDAASSDTPSSAATSDALPSDAAAVRAGKGRQPASADPSSASSSPAPSFMSQKKGKQASGPATAASAPAIRPNFVITTMNGQPLLVVEVKCPTTHRVKGMYECKGGDLEPREVSDNNPDSDAVKHNTTLGHLQGQLYDYLRSPHEDFCMVPYFGILTTYHEWAVYWLADDQEQHLQDTPSCTTECATVSDVGEFKKIILELERRATVTTDAQWPSLKVVPTFGNVHNPAATSAKVFQQGEATRRLIRTRVFKWNDPDLVNVLQNVIFKAYHLSQLRFHPHFGESSSCLLYSNNQLTQTRTHGRVQLDFNTFSNKVVRSGYIFGGPKPTNVYCFVDLGRGRDGHAWLASPYTKLNHGVCVLKVRNPRVTSSLSATGEAALWREIWGSRHKNTLIANPFLETHSVDDAIYMPYVKMVGDVRLCEDEERRPILVAAARAVEHMASLGYRHKDVRWRHVGIYRIMGDDTLYAVLIDLSDVEKVFDKAEARNSMLAKLDIDESLLEKVSPTKSIKPREQ